MRQRQPWNLHDSVLARLAVDHIEEGKSIYSQVKSLHDRWMLHRSWESIRQRINRMRRAQVASKAKKVVTRARTKRVPPSKRQKPSQRNLTVKDQRDIKREHESLRDSVWAGIEALSDQVKRLRDDMDTVMDRITHLEAYTGITEAETVPAPERTSAPSEDGSNVE